MNWSRLGIILFGLSFFQRVQSTALRCEIDSECPKPLVCRLICKRNCRSVCVRLRPTQQVIFDNTPLQIASYENEPFSTMSDMFVESNMELSTPVTISEMQVGSKEVITNSRVQQRDEIAIEPIHTVPLRRSRQRPPEINRLPQGFFNNELPRGPPAPALRHQLHTRVPPAPLNLNENSVIDFTEPPIRQRITPPNGPLPIPNGIPSPPQETIQIAVPSIAPSQGRRPPSPESITLSPWRKTHIPLSIPVNNRPAFRGHIQSSHPLKPPSTLQKPPKSSECPPPQICPKNCGVSIDEHGCQGCQCLFITKLCRHDSDCPHIGQFCDLGRCECRAGFTHSQTRSGICERTFFDSPAIVPHTSFQLNGAKNIQTTTEAYKSRPRRSELAGQKPNREERLQWPGPCTDDAECAPNLYCINSDCWHVPEKPLRSFKLENLEIRRSPTKKTTDQLFPLSNDYDEDRVTQEKPQEASPPSFLPDDIVTETTTPIPETTVQLTTTKSTIATTNGFITRPPKAKKQPKTKVPLSVESTTNDPLPEFDLNPLPPPLTDEQIDKEIESFSTLEPQQITDEMLNKEVDNLPSRNIPEFTKPTRTTKSRHTTQKPPSTSETWKEMTRESVTEYTPPNTQSSVLNNKMAHVFLDYSNRKKKPVRIEAFNALGKIKDECLKTEDCGQRLVCCAKRFCDLSLNCGNGRFCLPDCRLTKMIHLPGTFSINSTMIDLIYD